MAKSPANKLTNAKKKEYRSIGHNLNPVIIVSENGVSQGVIDETDRALNDHELIKVKFNVNDRDARAELINEICEATGAELIQTIGKIALILRFAKERNERLSNLLR
ncbi:YhbY family RNA-binding protein [Litoribrevibacter albus]|uniref:RNA-binding protein n=1 Tax=Litoribrevibacter albus TaxID=1473156 RepID=A0AA37S7S3_9GAMM|nr:YhbY family RNA-binding protein [Litoribrevibacter albus]GLQ29689.1 RNA-binding protein [Litoribrevibacter albus]